MTGPVRQGAYEYLRTGPQRDLIAEAGLIAPHWPPPWGIDAGPLRQLIIDEEFDKRPDLVRPSLNIAEWILPSVMRAAPKELQEQPDSAYAARRDRLVPAVQRAGCRLRSGRADNAGDQGRRRLERSTATRSGPRWRTRADYGALLARTDPDGEQAPRHRLLHPRHAVPRHRSPADQDGHRRCALQRGLPQRRVRARRHAAGRADRRVEPRDRHDGRRAFGHRRIRQVRQGGGAAPARGRTGTGPRRRPARARRTRRVHQRHQGAGHPGNHPAARRAAVRTRRRASPRSR